MINVKFMPENIEIICEYKDNLLEVARKANVFIDAPCNGNVSCGKCKVKIINGRVDTKKTTHITDEEYNNGYVLACNSKVIEDIQVEVPNKLSSSMNKMKIEDSSSDVYKKLLQNCKKLISNNNMEFKSYVRKDYVNIELPNLDDNISDFDRIKRHLRHTFGYEKVACKIETIRKIPNILREGNFKVTITHIPKTGNTTNIVNIESGDTTNKFYGIALDIGTTSVAACIVDLYEGKIVAKASSGNAQIKYGADVINRIIYSTKNDGLEKLNKAIIHETINPILKNMYNQLGINKNDIVALVAGGNTTMTHLLLNVYPDYLRMEPYIPAFSKSPYMQAKELEIEINSDAYIYITPCVASYVGGDITAGVLSSGIWSSDDNVLFIDLGTNGEIVFGNKDYLMTCACSAGPAFEGGEISCGMRASSGAIEKIKIDKDTLKPNLTIIADDKPQGICGSGIIDLIAEMLVNNIIDRRGKINKNIDSGRIRFDENEIGEYVLAFKEDYNIESDITITEVDIDSFIRAKGAVYSGIMTLVESLGMDFDMIDKVLIAGGIGSSLNIEKSILIGMLPDIDKTKYSYIGNSSLMGCYLALTSEDARYKLEECSDSMTYVELSVYPSYMDEFISACFLPHTDIEKFPSVKHILEC
ncbi:MAG: corrinoid activation/regeneration protein AcsV [Tepidibacter sp.]|uniref:corrinoid activation/regeneration protein AcsV n=1 Tax=Tepidibacter sp. TaxID=2529387 RepID=UPI0025F8D24F|nr:corrinoid activation/regeneration protein AcsV [Tepidibacter sp.]MCT4509169.1 corrinoid activation/regeneration protein AcsV [Tepidibacter sp.]